MSEMRAERATGDGGRGKERGGNRGGGKGRGRKVLACSQKKILAEIPRSVTTCCHGYLSPCCPVSLPVSATVGSPLLAAALSSLRWHQRAEPLGSQQSAPDHV